MSRAEDLVRTLSGSNSAKARVFRAPGRVNLIGEHTDYNDGFVMPAAIDFHTWVAAAPRSDRKVTVRSENYPGTVEFALDDAPAAPGSHWSDYVRGVALVLERAGHRLTGADLAISGDVPAGAGLSSSAAIEVATCWALTSLSGVTLDGPSMAKLCQQAENEYVGMRCGIMDQFISACAQKESALVLDCRSLEFRLLPLPADASVVICNTMVKHELATGEYNTRRGECEAGVRLLATKLPDVAALRDVTAEQLEAHGRELPEIVLRRCRHVVAENQRVTDAAAALLEGDLVGFGSLMADSHRSLRDDYEVSCKELDTMVEIASRQPGVYGARMTGGGFGGCTVNLVRHDAVDSFRREVASAYRDVTGITPEIYITTASAGAEEVAS